MRLNISCDIVDDSRQHVLCRPPTQRVDMPYKAFLEKAKLSLTKQDVDFEHYYLQLADVAANTSDLPFAVLSYSNWWVSGSGLPKIWQF